MGPGDHDLPRTWQRLAGHRGSRTRAEDFLEVHGQSLAGCPERMDLGLHHALFSLSDSFGPPLQQGEGILADPTRSTLCPS
jgi:hypothetical protein